VDGHYATWNALNKRFATTVTTVISVTVTGKAGAMVADCENGDLTPRQAAWWAVRELEDGRHPTVYGTADSLQGVADLLRATKFHPSLVGWWLAAWTTTEELPIPFPVSIPKGYVAHQFAGNVRNSDGHTIDASVVSEEWARAHGWTGEPHVKKVPALIVDLEHSVPKFVSSGLYVSESASAAIRKVG
jgi:hypothetical protein